MKILGAALARGRRDRRGVALLGLEQAFDPAAKRAQIPDYPNPSNAWLGQWYIMLQKHRITPAFYSSRLEDATTPQETLEIATVTAIPICGVVGYLISIPFFGSLVIL